MANPTLTVSVVVYHLRRRLPPKRGGSFYRDSAVRTAQTFCGLPPTEWDGDWRSKAQPWHGATGRGVVYVACPACCQAREGFEG